MALPYWLAWLLGFGYAAPRPATWLRITRSSRQMSTANLSWLLPTTRVDGSPLAPSDIASVHVFDGGTQIGTVTADPKNSFTTPTLEPGSHLFTVVVVDQNGTASSSSSAVSLIVAAPTPAAPFPATELTATLNA